MGEKKLPWWLVVGGGVLVGLLLVACLGLVLWRIAWPWGPGVAGPTGYRSNGEQIYLTATSQRGTPIVSDMGMGMMGGGMMTCASCHGPDGRGGQVQMMMHVFETPDIRYKTLTQRNTVRRWNTSPTPTRPSSRPSPKGSSRTVSHWTGPCLVGR